MQTRPCLHGHAPPSPPHLPNPFHVREYPIPVPMAEIFPSPSPWLSFYHPHPSLLPSQIGSARVRLCRVDKVGVQGQKGTEGRGCGRSRVRRGIEETRGCGTKDDGTKASKPRTQRSTTRSESPWVCEMRGEKISPDRVGKKLCSLPWRPGPRILLEMESSAARCILAER